MSVAPIAWCAAAAWQPNGAATAAARLPPALSGRRQRCSLPGAALSWLQVKPYHFDYCCSMKQRWFGQSIIDVFSRVGW